MIRYFVTAVCALVVGWFAHAAYDSPQASYERDPVELQPPIGGTLLPPAPKPLDASGTRVADRGANGDDSARETVLRDTADRREDANEMFSATLLAHYAEDFRRGWLSVRQPGPDAAQMSAGERVFRAEVSALPAQLGARHGTEQNERDELARAIADFDGIALLSATAESGFEGDRAEFVGELLDHVVEPKLSAGERDGAEFIAQEDEPITEGLTIRFGAGVFELSERRLRGADRRSLPADVTIVGAGMDATLLRIGDISIDGDAIRLRFRDLTIDAENDGMFDMRSGAAVLDLERVRVVRFDAGHGGCYIFSVREGAVIRARQCRFEGGYGRSPGNGNLLRSPTVIARFEDCRFELIRGLSLDQAGHIEFRGCSFERLDRNPIDHAGETTSFVNCTFSDPLQVSYGDPSLAKDLGDLFWQVKGK
jgi:hypothetical protein